MTATVAPPRTTAPARPAKVVVAVVLGAVGALLVADPAVLVAAGSTGAADLLRWSQWAVLAAAPVVAAPVLAGRISARPLGWLLAFHAWAVATAVFADAPGLAFLRSLALLSVTLLAVHVVERHGWTTVAAAVVASLWWTLAAGLLAFVLLDVPARAGGRLQLLTPEHNQLGRLAALTVVASVTLLARSDTAARAVGAASALTGVLVLGLTGSRTAMVAVVLALLVAMARRLGVVALVALVALGLSVLAVVATTGVEDRLLDVAAREEDGEDLRTATGRTGIWEAMLDVWLEEPVTGHGTGTDASLTLAESQDGRIGFIARNTQSLAVHELVEHGVVGAFLLVGAVLSYALVTGRTPRPVRDGLLVVLLVGGFSEAVLDRPDVSLFVLAAVLADARVAHARVRIPRAAAG
jgi:O-antigen ligase